MRISIIYLLLSMLFILGSCIKNDLPYPNIKGEILEIATGNMIESKIDIEAGTVTITIPDDAKLDSVYITKLLITEGFSLSLDPDVLLGFTNFPDSGFVSIDSLSATSNTCINANEPFEVMLSLYKDYQWTITIEREINRIIRVKNQVGNPLVDIHNKIVVIYVDSITQPKFDNIEIEMLQLGSSIAITTPDPTTITDFRRPKTFEVTAFGETETWTVSIMHPSGDAMPTEVSVWARRAYVRGLSKNREVYIQFRPEKDSIWDNVLASELTFDDKGVFTAVMTHLRPSTTYEYIIAIDDAVEDVSTFKTDSFMTVPNLSFDDWFKDGKIWYAKKEIDDIYWDSGNEGGALANANPTAPETSVVVKGKAAALKSTSIVGKFAAGNLYTGQFAKLLGTEGAELDFGHPFTGRPSALKGYYQYKSGIVDKFEAGYEAMEGKSDSCHIYIALFDWTAPFRVNTVEGIFADLSWNNPSLIAFQEFKTDKSGDTYIPIRLNLEYRDYFTQPSYILIVASASKYGDFFTGSTSSVLYLDEFELVYE